MCSSFKSLFFHTVSLISRAEQSFDHFYPKAFCLPQMNRQETSVALAGRGRRSKGAFKKFGELRKRHVLSEAENKGSERINAGR